MHVRRATVLEARELFRTKGMCIPFIELITRDKFWRNRVLNAAGRRESERFLEPRHLSNMLEPGGVECSAFLDSSLEGARLKGLLINLHSQCEQFWSSSSEMCSEWSEGTNANSRCSRTWFIQRWTGSRKSSELNQEQLDCDSNRDLSKRTFRISFWFRILVSNNVLKCSKSQLWLA